MYKKDIYRFSKSVKPTKLLIFSMAHLIAFNSVVSIHYHFFNTGMQSFTFQLHMSV